MTARQKEVLWTIGDWTAWTFETLFEVLWTTAKVGYIVGLIVRLAIFTTSRFVPR
jgi:hypothetical protein